MAVILIARKVDPGGDSGKPPSSGTISCLVCLERMKDARRPEAAGGLDEEGKEQDDWARGTKEV